MGDKWQMEAVHEQFEVFDTLTKPYLQINDVSVSQIIVYVQDTIRKHLRATDKQTSTVREICTTIINNVGDDDLRGQLSFIVIVTNQYVNKKLSKIPVFVIVFQGSYVFVDLYCGVYKTWASFMENNDLPTCEFCFPVGGNYEYKGKLSIDFGKSSKSVIYRLWTKMSSTTHGIIASAAIVAASYFFKVQPRVLADIAQTFIPSATELLGSVTKYIDLFSTIQNLVANVRQGGFSLQTMSSIFKTLMYIHNNFKEEISKAVKGVQKTFIKVYRYINQKLRGLLELASFESRHAFLAVMDQTNSEMERKAAQAEAQLSEVRSGTQSQLVPISDHNNLYLKQIFEDVVEKTAASKRMDDKSRINLETDLLHNKTQDLLLVSRKLALDLGKENLNELQEIFEAVKPIVVHKYEKYIYDHSQVVAAARASTRDELDLTTFNTFLKIDGDPEDHHWKEALTAVQDPYMIPYIKEKVKQVQNNKRIFLLRLWKKGENNRTGFYQCTGITGNGKISARNIIEACQSEAINMNEDNVVINETSSQIFIRSNMYSVALYQELDEQNTAQGIVYICKHSE